MAPYGIRDTATYERNKSAAKHFALSHGFAEDSFVELAVQWGDQDPNGHVNNASYFRYLETGRIIFLDSITHLVPPEIAASILGSGKGKGLVLGSVSLRYERPTFAPDHVLVAHKVRSVNDCKMVVEALIYSYQQQARVGTGDAVMVGFDYDEQKSCVLPEAIVAELERRRKEGLVAMEGKAKL